MPFRRVKNEPSTKTNSESEILRVISNTTITYRFQKYVHVKNFLANELTFFLRHRSPNPLKSRYASSPFLLCDVVQNARIVSLLLL